MKTAIYGAGSIGRKLYTVLKKKGLKVDFFIDQYSKQTSLEGVPVYRLKDAPKDAVVYVAVLEIPYEVPETVIKVLGNRYLFSSKILHEYGFNKVVKFAEWLKEFPEFFEAFVEDECLWWRKDKEKMLNYGRLNELESILKDKQSKEELIRLIRFRENFTYEFYPFPTKEVQYFPADVIPKTWKNINFVDVGSFIGDTLPWLFHFYGNEVKSVVCFEPEKENLHALNSIINRFKSLYSRTNFIVIPAAVWSSSGFTGFNSMGPSSKVSNTSENLVPLVTLDETLMGYTPTYIKMDVEGAELEAIKGAKELIKRTKPYLAISIYHRPEDLCEIPLLIKEEFPFYDLFIRVHWHFGLETVLYCVPNG